MKHNRIYIIGAGGSGKTFLAKKLSERFKMQYGILNLSDNFFARKVFPLPPAPII